MYCTPGDEHDLMSQWRTFLLTLNLDFPSTLQVTFPTAGAIINEADGELTSSWSDSSPVSPIVGANTATWVNGVGARVKWFTGSFHGGRQVVGSTFLVPLAVGTYEGAGNIVDSVITAVNGAAATFLTPPVLRIYSRPRTGVLGASFAVTSGQCPDRVSWLRGRRT